MRTPASGLSDAADFREFDDEDNESMIDGDFVGRFPGRKRHGRNRCVRQKRRKVPKASHPGCGIGSRRMRRESGPQDRV
jgi:hypothetical protein